ncbi:uncharacterized protein LOC117100939 [Anneissia japonica]|uniref:uncharacterized protein LOC117100939 n=1 Tax=Anneissia japonica TaxID=1529436 RepID=UPI00142578ED|nr:uncharacterized protein LOC117100939 [Anneissia japonica]XP_033096673.1 uncharacterized protein LOC117100939 [Anneissia japonica]
MDAMSDTMVLKRKHSPTPPDWDTSSNQNDEPASPSSSVDEVCSPDESTKPKKKKKKRVNFNGVTVYYFQRSQGFTCVPSQGGSTLGMEHIHDFEENYTLNGFALEQDRQHRQLLREQLLERKQRQMLENGNHNLVDKNIHEIDAEKELQKINVEEYYFLQPVTTKRRRLMLRSAGVTKIESWEKSELKKIRLSREKCGCDCKSFCNPSTCACSLAGIKCQVDRLSFPCGCSKDGCGNKTGRVEFNPVKVRTHFLHTLMRLEIENGKDNVLSGKSLKDDENSASYTKLENSVCLDESSDRVLDHGQCKECDSIPYTDYTDQYTSNHYLNGQNKPGLQGQFLQELDSAGMYSQAIGTSMSFNCSNPEMPLDLQSQSNSNNHLPCVVTYDESNHSTLNSPANLSCNVPLSVMSGYESSTTEESLSSESECDSPYMNTSISLENTGFDSTSTKSIDNGIFQTPDSSPDQQYTKLMPLDLSHTLDDYEPVDDTPTYTQLNTSSRTCSVSFCSQVSDTQPMSTQASLIYTDFANDCNHLPFSTNTCKTESMSTQNLSTIVTCSLDEQSDLFSDYTSDSDHHTVSTKNNNCMPPMNHNKPPVELEENTVEYFHVTALSSGPDEDGQLDASENNVCGEPHEFRDMTPASSDVELEKCLVNEEIPEICLPSDGKLNHLPDETLNSCHLKERISDLMPLSKEAKDCLLPDRTEKESLLTGENNKIASCCVEPVEDVHPFKRLSQKPQACQQMEEINEPCLPSGGPAAEESFSQGESLEKYVLAKDSDVTVLPDKSVEDSSDGNSNQYLPNTQLLKMCQQSPDGTVDGCQLYDDANVKTMVNESENENCVAVNEALEKFDGELEEKVSLGTQLEVAAEVINEEQEKVLTKPNETMVDCLSNDETEFKTEQSGRAIDGFISSKISLNESSSAGELSDEILPLKDCQSTSIVLQESAIAEVEVAKTIDELEADDYIAPALDNVTSAEITGENLPSEEIEKESQLSNKELDFVSTLKESVEKNQDFTYTAKSAISEAL